MKILYLNHYAGSPKHDDGGEAVDPGARPGGRTEATADDARCGSAMLKDYAAQKNAAVTTQIDGLAASAASVVAMAGSVVEMNPVGMMMIHNPWTFAEGDRTAMPAESLLLAQDRKSVV